MNMKTKWIIITVCIVVLVTAAISIRLTFRATTSAPADQTGPYKVGFMANTYYDSTRSDYAGGARPIVTLIWYPAAPDNNGNPMLPAVYPMNPNFGLTEWPDASSTNFEAYGIDPAYQEAAAAKDGPFPLVIFSPGSHADALFYVHIGTRLASHGFVVAIPTNYDDKLDASGVPVYYPNYDAFSVGPYVERTRDIEYLLDRLVADMQQSDNLLHGVIQRNRIAVAGHSLGGLAALALAGGDDQTCDWPMGLADPNAIPPELCVPVQLDPRIKAIVSIDGTSYALHYDELSRIKIPSLVMGQEWNSLDAPKMNSETLLARPHAAMQGHPNYRVDVANATHNLFTSICPYIQVWYDLGILDEAMRDTFLQANCPQEPITPAEIENLVTQYMIAFFKTELARETGYKEMLTPGYAVENEPFIEFFVTEKGSSKTVDEEGYFSYFKHQADTEQAKALKEPTWEVPEAMK
jgi:predicted dienelactone hydrolase